MHTLLAQQTTLAANNDQVFGIAFGALFLVALLAYAVLFIGALISIATSRINGGMKLAWIVFAFVAPFLGSLLWFLVGRRDAQRGRVTA